MLKLKKVTDVYNLRVFTDTGEYYGDVEETVLTTSKVFGWKVKASKNSYLSKVLGGAKGVIVPHQMVKAISDVIVISRSAIPSVDDNENGEMNDSE